MAVAAGGHGAPTAAARAGIVVEEKAARRIRAAFDGSSAAFDDELGGGAGDCGEEPLEAAFAAEELEAPAAFLEEQLVVPLGDAQDFVDGRGPRDGKFAALLDGGKDGPKAFAETEDFQQDGVDGGRFGVFQGIEALAPVAANDTGIDEEGDKFLPGEIVRRWGQIGKVEGQFARNQGNRTSGKRHGQGTF